jgi:hypothetical protein
MESLPTTPKGKGKGRAGLGEGKRQLSWIWTNLTAVLQAGDDPGLNDGEWGFD